MTVSLKHAFNNAIADDPADALAGKTLPSHWNAEHNLTGTANALFGFSSGGAALDLTGTSWDATNQALTLTSIANPAASTLTLTGGTGLTTSKPVLSMTQTWNAGGVTFDAILATITNTASAAGSALLRIIVGSTTTFKIRTEGTVQLNSSGFEVSTDGVAGNTSRSLVASNAFYMRSSAFLSWSSSTSDVVPLDAQLSRAAAGKIQAGTTAANALGILLATGLETVGSTVASLPAAAAGNKGQRRHVTDANATTFASVVAGGGANIVPVFSDGTNWIIA